MAELVTASPMLSLSTAVADTSTVVHAIEQHQRWMARGPNGKRADLRGRCFRGLTLDGCALDEAILRDADFSEAYLERASFVRADLRFASFRGANLRGADFSGALLDFSSLAEADVSGAKLLGASLSAANLDNIRMAWFDPTLLSERLWRAAGDNLELQMLAAYIGRTTERCWSDHRNLPAKYRRWIFEQFCRWKRPGDEAPPILSRISRTL